MRILYVKNSPDDAETTRVRLLEAAPAFSLEVVSSCRDAIQCLSQPGQLPGLDLVLINLQPADGSGMEVLHHIRSQGLDLPVVLIIPSGDEKVVMAALAAGTDAYVTKTVDYLDQLPGVIESAYHRWHLLRQSAALKESQEALRQSEHRFRRLRQEYHTLLEAIPDCITLHGPDLKVIWANRQAVQIMGDKALHAVVGHTCCELINDGQIPCQGCPVARSIQTGETVYTTAATGNRHWDLRVVPVKDDSGKVEAVVRIAREVTETHRLQQQLFQAQKMEAIGTLAGGIAHDFNNILAAIIGFAEMALQQDSTGQQSRLNVREILKAGMRAKELVHQILAFSRQTEQRRRPVQIAAIVEEALKLLRSILPVTIAMESRIQTNSLIEADPTQIHQVIINLGTNAAHAMRERGGILTALLTDVYLDTVTAVNHQKINPGHYVRLTIEDTGHGMDADTLERIFEPYFTTKKIGEGTGLGLAVAHGIIKSHKGAITVKSRPGVGTAFTLFFPVTHEKTADFMPSAASPRIPKGKESILFVDDEESLTRLSEQMLKRLGYQPHAFHSAGEALDFFRQAPKAVDLLITDLTMPHMSGLELAEACTALRPDLPVILCTGHGNMGEQRRISDQLNIRALIGKPVRLQDLASTIRRVLDEPS